MKSPLPIYADGREKVPTEPEALAEYGVKVRLAPQAQNDCVRSAFTMHEKIEP